MYAGYDEADPFRSESAQEMREKFHNNALLLEGHRRAGANDPSAGAGADMLEAAEALSDKTTKPIQPVAPTQRYVPPQRRSRGKHTHARKLDLHAILTDDDVQRKYKFTAMNVAELRAVREEDPEQAVAYAQSLLEHGGFRNTTVTTATWAQFTKAEATNELAYLAATEGADSCLVDAKVSSTTVAGDSIHFLSGPEVVDTEFLHEWEIICPITRAKSGMDYYKLLMKLGYDEAFARAGPAAASLGISVVHNTARIMLHHPTVEAHAASPADAPFDYVGLTPTPIAETKCAEVVKAIAPVLQQQLHTAYTVAIAGSGRLLNDHVRRKANTTKFFGKELRKFQTFRLSGDLWFFYDTTDAGKPPAMRHVARTRPPVMGESARLLVPHPDDFAMCFLGPCGVVNPGFDGAWCLDAGTTEYAQRGMSGLPIVAESDGALIAIHDGLVLNTLRILAIPANVACDAYVETAVPRLLSYTCPGAKTITHTDLEPLKRRKEPRENLMAINDALDHDGNRTLLSCYGSRCYVGGRQGEMRPPGFSFGFVSTGAEGRVSGLPMRAPVGGDRVVIVGQTDEGTYCSPVCSVGERVSDSIFPIELGGNLGATDPDMFNGAVVVAVDDARVVGFVSTKGISEFAHSNHTLLCWACEDALPANDTTLGLSSLAMSSKSSDGAATSASSGMFTFGSGSHSTRCGPASLADIRTTLIALFPEAGFEDAGCFTDSDLDEVFSHPSLNQYSVSTNDNFAANRYWARMGDSAMSYLVMNDMRMNGTPDTRATQVKSAVQNNTRQASVANQLGLQRMYMFRVGASISEHNLADLLEAILGWVVECKGLQSTAAVSVYNIFKMGYQDHLAG